MKKAVLAAAVILQSCATIVSDSDYPVIVGSSPQEASYQIYNEDGILVTNGMTPNTVRLEAGAGYFDGETYTIKLKKEGYEDQTFILNTKLDPWYVGNLLIGGWLGGLIVDPLTGAMFKIPNQVQIPLNAKPAAPSLGQAQNN